MSHNIAQRIARISVVAALYAGITLAGAPLAYGAVQFRFAEALILLCFFRKDYCYSMVIGCAIANLFSPLGMWDAFFGSCATALAVAGVRLMRAFHRRGKNFAAALLLSTFFPVICNGFIVAAELYYLAAEPFLISLAAVSLGEFVVVTGIGFPLFSLLSRNRVFLRAIRAENDFCRQNCKAC